MWDVVVLCVVWQVGVCGRTGSGKSSLALALFRLIEARSGSLLIDGVDVSDVALRTLRSRLGMVPQEPTLFTGTLRCVAHNMRSHTT